MAAQEREPLLHPGKDAPEDALDEKEPSKKNAASGSEHPDQPDARKKQRTSTTPPTLKSLLPHQGGKLAKEVWILRNAKTFGYQIRYPTGVLA